MTLVLLNGFDVSVAHVWAEQEHPLERVGQRMPVGDGYIAATARRCRLTIRNIAAVLGRAGSGAWASASIIGSPHPLRPPRRSGE